MAYFSILFYRYANIARKLSYYYKHLIINKHYLSLDTHIAPCGGNLGVVVTKPRFHHKETRVSSRGILTFLVRKLYFPREENTTFSPKKYS